MEEVYHRFTQLADNKKGLRNDEIVALIELVTKNASVAAGAER
jgi:hypothetical protein